MIRALPIPVRPIDGETSASYFRRLATENSLPLETLWGCLRHLRKELPVKRNVELATTELETLGGLPPGWFTKNRRHHLLPIRCPHSRWAFAVCMRCSRLPTTQSGCIRCGHGHKTQVTTRTGPICIRHGRWHLADADINVSALKGYIAAERAFRGTLTRRGISLNTGELLLASHLLSAWAAPVPDPSYSLDDALFWSFPSIVNLTIVLTDPEFIELLLSPRWSPSQHATLLSMTITATVGHRELSDTDTLWQTVNHHSEAVRAAYGMVGTRRRSRTCTMERAFFSAAYTQRACLLKHLDATHMPTIRNPARTRPAPTARQLAALRKSSLLFADSPA